MLYFRFKTRFNLVQSKDSSNQHVYIAKIIQNAKINILQADESSLLVIGEEAGNREGSVGDVVPSSSREWCSFTSGVVNCMVTGGGMVGEGVGRRKATGRAAWDVGDVVH